MTTVVEAGPYPSQQETLPESCHLTIEDKSWLETFGCHWPDANSEAEWLESMNQLVSVGSIRISEADFNHGQSPDSILRARELFLDSLAAIDETARHEIKDNSMWTMPLDTIIGTQRVLYKNGIDAAKAVNAIPVILNYAPESVVDKLDNLTARGIDAAKAVNAFPVILNYAPESVVDKLDNLTARGIDAAKVVNAFPSLLGYAPESVHRKLNVIYSAARAWGLKDYRSKANGLIEAWPVILGYKPDKIKTLIRIASYSLPAQHAHSILTKHIQSIVINNLEATLAGYLEEGADIQEPQDIIRLGKKYKKLGRAVLLDIIAAHADDPAVKVYLRGYPLKNTE